ncbi:MAG: SUF system NifU family Fe-S cluster assembly protein [Gammaproteobacteria bacterium]
MFGDLQDLYQEVIIDHNRSPRNYGEMHNADRQAEGFNPLCGDKLTLFLKLNDNNIIESVSFIGEGCAISTASASLLTEQIRGKTIEQAQHLFNAFHTLVTSDENDTSELGKLAVLAGVKAYPSRVKCATLAWHTLQAALNQTPELISTE